MTDQALNHTAASRTVSSAAENSIAPVASLIRHLKAYFARKTESTIALEADVTRHPMLTRNLPVSRRQQKDAGLTNEYTAYDTRNEVANVAARHGIPI